jgi:hypothetical protein
MNMKPNLLAALEQYPVIKEYLSNIPTDIWDLLLPDSPADLAQFSSDIRSCRAQQEERDFIMEVQIRHGLPLRPNASVRDTVIAVRIQHLREKRRRMKKHGPYNENPPPHPDSGEQMI